MPPGKPLQARKLLDLFASIMRANWSQLQDRPSQHQGTHPKPFRYGGGGAEIQQKLLRQQILIEDEKFR